MGLFDIFKKEEEASESIIWTVRLQDEEHIINNPDAFEGNVDDALTRVEMSDAEFLVLSPSKPLNKIAFLQACPDTDSGYLHIEAGLDDKNPYGFPKVVCQDHLTTGEVLDLFISFFRNHIIDTKGWYELGFK